jgi:uncharacterized protein YmfQ (DUF2313 family)
MVAPLVYVAFGGLKLTWRDAYLRWDGPMTDRQRFGLISFSEAEYQRALAALLPTGPAWSCEPGSIRGSLLMALARELHRVDTRAAQLWSEVDPAATAELLPDWERVVGLPDPCVTVAQTVAERRQALEARLTSSGGQSRAFFIQLAARLGYVVTITEFPSAAAATAAGVPFVGDEWAFIWRMNVPQSVGVRPFLAGAGAAGEPLRAWGNQALECQVLRLKPAHTRVLFAYAA